MDLSEYFSFFKRAVDLNEKHLKRAAQHHARTAVAHKAIAAGIEKLGKAKSDIESIDHEDLNRLLSLFIAEHSALGNENAEFGEHCAEMAAEAREAEKAAGDAMNKAASGVAPTALEAAVRAIFLKEFGNTIMPSGVSAVAPNRPGGIIAVPRAGAQPMPGPADVPFEFQKLVEVDDGNEQPSPWRR